MDNRFVYVAADGDSIGSKVARASLADDVDNLHDISSKIEAGNELIKDFAIKHGGQVISGGGDEANIRIPLDAVEELESLRTDYSYVVGATLSIGVGEKLSQASKALDVAKLNGKNQILQYSEEVEQKWQQTSQQINSGNPADEEARKIGEAHMKNDEQKPQGHEDPVGAPGPDGPPGIPTQEDDHSDCPYCQEAAEELGEDDCPYCQEEDVESGLNDCPYCQEAHTEEQHQHDDNCPHCQEMDNAQAQADPAQAGAVDAPVDPSAQVQPDPAAVAPSSDIEQEPGSEEHKTPEEVMGEFDQAHGLGDPSQQDQTQTDQIDDAGIAEGGKGQEENISRPGDFDNKIPQGSEDPNNTDGSQDPNYADIMQQDLNNNADDIQREKVGDIVRQALQAFKANKMFLEQAQSQAPEFYQANILMLKGMIEMAKLLGFSGPAQQSNAAPELGQQEGQMLAQQPDPANPFPTHPDNGGAAAPASGDSDDKGDWNNPFPQHPDNGGDAAGKPQGQ